MSKKIDQGIATRGQIVAIARRLFTELGFTGASTEAVLRESGVSRGALYHHFASKEALFEAVLEAVEADIVAKTSEAARRAAQKTSPKNPDPLAGLRAGMEAFLDMARDPEVRQIVLIDALPAVGWEKWRALDERYGFGRIKAAFGKIAETGKMRKDMVDTWAHMLLAMEIEAAFLIARAENPAVTTRKAKLALNQWLDRLLS